MKTLAKVILAVTLSVLEIGVLSVALPIILLALIAFGVLLCARAAASRVRGRAEQESVVEEEGLVEV